MCANCGNRKALFQSKGRHAKKHLHTDRRHDLCRRCNRNQRNSLARPLPALAVLLLLLFSGLPARAQTTTVIGTIKDLAGNTVPGGQVTFELRPGGDTTITGNGRFTSSTVTCNINQSTDFSAVRTANNVAVTFSTPHSFINGDVVVVTDMSVSSFNGTFTIGTVTDTLHVSWTQVAGNASASGGTISALRATPGPGSCTVMQNTALQPAGTSYLVCLWPLGARTSCFNWYAIGIGPVDLSTTVPTPGGMPAYAFVDTINNQTVGGNKTFSGTVTFQGQVILPLAASVSGIFSTTSANPATTGTFRSANNENGWCARNAGNSANLCLVLDATNTLKFNGSALATGGTVTSFSAADFSPLFTTSEATPTTTPALSFSVISQNQNLHYASPCGSSGNPTFRALCVTDFNSGSSASTGTVWRGDGAWANGVTGDWGVNGNLPVGGDLTATNVAASDKISAVRFSNQSGISDFAFTFDGNCMFMYGNGGLRGCVTFGFATNGSGARGISIGYNPANGQFLMYLDGVPTGCIKGFGGC